MPKTSGGSTSTCWPDAAYVGGSRVLCFGGDWSSALNAGPFVLSANSAASSAIASVGARLDFS
jgi:hypothetical protein